MSLEKKQGVFAWNKKSRKKADKDASKDQT